MIKVVLQEGELTKTAVRNIRGKANERVKNCQISDDDKKQLKNKVQNLTDISVNHLIDSKKADLMKIE